MKYLIYCFILAAATWPALPAGAADDPPALAVELARLRAEVEQLAAALDDARDAMKTDLRGYAAQQAELRVEVEREELRVKGLARAHAEAAARLAADDALQADFKPRVTEAAQSLLDAIDAGIPFRADERRADVRRTVEQVTAGELAPRDGLVRLWETLEDELRLTRESGLYSQVVSLDGAEVLAEVAKLGMAALYFKTADGRVGHALREGAAWRFVAYPDRPRRLAVLDLFAAFKKQVRTGLFTLPNALSTDEVRP